MIVFTQTKNINGIETICFTEAAIKLLANKFTLAKLPSVGVYYSFNTSGNPADYCFYVNSNSVFKQSASMKNQDLIDFTSACYEADEAQQVKEEEIDVDEEIYHIGLGKELMGKTIKVKIPMPECLKTEPNEISTGGVCEYYRVRVTHPISQDQVMYIAECGDIMESLEMTYAEANIFKEIWRTAVERTLGVKKAGNNGQRAGEKVVFFANRYYEQQVNQANITGSRRVLKTK